MKKKPEEVLQASLEEIFIESELVDDSQTELDLDLAKAKHYDSEEKKERNQRILRILSSPFRLILEGGKLGIKGVSRFIFIALLFSISNLILFIYALFKLFTTEFHFYEIGALILVIILGVAATIYAVYRTYQFVIFDTYKTIYGNLSFLFQKISNAIIEQVEKLFDSEIDFEESRLKKAVDIGKLVNSKYQKIPGFLRKGIILILKRVPIMGMVVDLKEKIMMGEKVQAGAALYEKMDKFILSNIFSQNNTKWVWWFYPLNILVLLIFIWWKIG